jgi:hypothetical protein
VALARPLSIKDLLVLVCPSVVTRQQDIEVNPRVVHKVCLRLELLLVVQAASLPRLSVSSVSLLLDLVRGLNVALLVVSISEGNFGLTLVAKLRTVMSMGILVDLAPCREGSLPVL